MRSANVRIVSASKADNLPTMLWVTNAKGEARFINRTYREFCGTTYEQVAGGRWKLLLHPEDAMGYVAAFDRSVKERAPFRAEARIRRADGEWRLLGSNATALLSESGEFLGHVGLSADITERRRTEQALLDARELAQSIIDALSSHICVLNEAGTVIAVNRAWKGFWAANYGEADLEDQGRDGFGMGVNYLDVCDQAAGADTKEATEVAAGIRAVLDGKCEEYTSEYACHSPNEKRWFICRVTRFIANRLPRIVVEHINISRASVVSWPCAKARRSFANWPRISAKCFGC